MSAARYEPGHPSKSRLLGGPGCRHPPCRGSKLRLPGSEPCGPAARDQGPCRVAARTAGRSAAPRSRFSSHGDGDSYLAWLQAADSSWAQRSARESGREPHPHPTPSPRGCRPGVFFWREMRPEIRTGEALRLRGAAASSSVLDRMNHNVKKDRLSYSSACFRMITTS